jgi:Family of unknown function (DUF6263)
MIRRLLLSSWCVLGIATVSFGQVKLERKIHEGTSYTSEVTSQIDQKLVIAGMDTQTNVQTRTTARSTVGKRDVAGMLKVQEKIESLNINMSANGQDYSFDSTAPDNKGNSALEMLRDIHKVLAKRTSTVIYDKENRIYAIESDQDLLNSVPAELQPIVKSQVDPEYLKKAANQELDQLPKEPVNKGDSWQRTEIANFGAGQVMTFQTKYTYEGTIEKEGRKLEKITTKVLSVDFTLQDSPLPLQLKASDLKAEESDGTILFDRDAGIVVESNSSIRIVGDITFAFNGMDLPSKLDLKMQSGHIMKR